MTDYRHDLLYGTFVTPVVRTAREAVELAVTADEAGLDLVTYQDHPYHPGLLDTWTLLSHVATRTEGIRLSGNVLSLPLRPPAVLARAAASLDILSGGRFELGLGAGAFWEGIAAMGGRKLTPAQSVEALREGITIIRELWNTDAPAGLRFDGEFYRISGAKRGPRPAHDIAIWIGAYKPKMLALTGAVGDGWVPTLEYLPDGVDSLPELNSRIDEAAVEAGRSPGDVRRLLNVMNVSIAPTSRGVLNGPPSQWIDQLADLALDHGISAVLIGGDDRDLTRQFASEIVPAVRELVERERSTTGAQPL